MKKKLWTIFLNVLAAISGVLFINGIAVMKGVHI